MRRVVLVSALFVLLAQPAAAIVHERTFSVPDVGTIRYGVSVPDDYDPREPRPLVLVLHPNERIPYFGVRFMMAIVSPALNDLGGIMVAPDCPARAWTDPTAERSVMALLKNILDEFAVDRSRILVTGYSMGGRGTWFMESRHADLFTGAIVMAGSPGDEPLDRLATIPTFVIHSRDDQVVPFAPSESTTRELEKAGRVIKFEALEGLGHYDMGGYVDSLRRAGLWIAERWKK